MGEPATKRPGIVTIAIAWSFLGLLNIWVAITGVSSNIAGWHLISDPLTHEWLKLAIPAELGLFVAILIAALFQLLSIPGLPRGKSWSYKLALGVPILVAIFSLALGVLYAIAPPEFSELQSQRMILAFLFAVFQLVAAFLFWKYLNRPEAKMFLEMMQKQSASK